MKTKKPTRSLAVPPQRTPIDRQRFRPAIRGRWEELLRAETAPAATFPAPMIDAVDGIISRIFSPAAAPGLRWLRQAHMQVAQLQNQCACGLRPLLAYFVAGDQALIEAETGEQEESAAVIERARVLLHVLAQLEIEFLCEECSIRLSRDCPDMAAHSSGQ